eukprot:396024_1
MSSLLIIYPFIAIYVLIPFCGNQYDTIFIGIYLFVILLLQVFGTYRGLKSFNAKHKITQNESGNQSEFKPQYFKWNIGSLWAVMMVIYEVNQMALFAFHTINDEDEPTEETEEPII